MVAQDLSVCCCSAIQRPERLLVAVRSLTSWLGLYKLCPKRVVRIHLEATGAWPLLFHPVVDLNQKRLDQTKHPSAVFTQEYVGAVTK